MRDGRADGNDETGRFMAENEGGAHEEGAVGAVGIVFHVGAAEAGGADGDLEIVRAWRGQVVGFLRGVGFRVERRGREERIRGRFCRVLYQGWL